MVSRPAAVFQQSSQHRQAVAGERKSQRQRFRPLEYWRGERVVYAQQDGMAPFEQIVDVVVADATLE